MNDLSRTVRRSLIACVAAAGFVTAAVAAEAPTIEKQSWPFSGITGTFDQAQLQRGFKVYREVCSACHSISRVPFRSLAEPGGPGFPEEQVSALAEEYEITAGPNELGEMFTRPGRISDTFPPLYRNPQEARSIHGAYPPDLSLIANARGIPHAQGVFTHLLTMGKEILTGYEEGGADYTYALLTGYRDEPPEGFNLQDGLYYNAAYPGNQFAMPNPFYGEGQVEYPDGTPGTVENYSKDVTAFLFWAANPHHDQRTQMGWLALVYLLITTVLLYIAYKRTWKGIKH